MYTFCMNMWTVQFENKSLLLLPLQLSLFTQSHLTTNCTKHSPAWICMIQCRSIDRLGLLMAAKFAGCLQKMLNYQKSKQRSQKQNRHLFLLLNARCENSSNIFAIYQFSLANLAVSLHKQPNMAILPEVHRFASKKICQIRVRWEA